MEILVCDIPAGDGKTANLFLQCMWLSVVAIHYWLSGFVCRMLTIECWVLVLGVGFLLSGVDC